MPSTISDTYTQWLAGNPARVPTRSVTQPTATPNPKTPFTAAARRTRSATIAWNLTNMGDAPNTHPSMHSAAQTPREARMELATRVQRTPTLRPRVTDPDRVLGPSRYDRAKVCSR